MNILFISVNRTLCFKQHVDNVKAIFSKVPDTKVVLVLWDSLGNTLLQSISDLLDDHKVVLDTF